MSQTSQIVSGYGPSTKSFTTGLVRQQFSNLRRLVSIEGVDIIDFGGTINPGDQVIRKVVHFGSRQHRIHTAKWVLDGEATPITYGSLPANDIAGFIAQVTVPEGCDIQAEIDNIISNLWDSDSRNNLSAACIAAAGLTTDQELPKQHGLKFLNDAKNTDYLEANLENPNLIIGPRDIVVIELNRIADAVFGAPAGPILFDFHLIGEEIRG